MAQIQMTCFLLVLTLGVFLLALPAQAQQCPPNQQFNECGSACPPKCNSPPAQFCTANCVIGCQCKTGFLLNSAGDCVPPNQC